MSSPELGSTNDLYAFQEDQLVRLYQREGEPIVRDPTFQNFAKTLNLEPEALVAQLRRRATNPERLPVAETVTPAVQVHVFKPQAVRKSIQVTKPEN